MPEKLASGWHCNSISEFSRIEKNWEFNIIKKREYPSESCKIWRIESGKWNTWLKYLIAVVVSQNIQIGILFFKKLHAV